MRFGDGEESHRLQLQDTREAGWHGLELADVKISMNPFDEISVEEALRLKEAGKATEVVVASVGPAKGEETLRTALATGADRAILVEIDDVVEPLAVAKLLKGVADAERPGLIIVGKQAIDDGSNQTGQMLAPLMGVAQATFASKIEITDGTATVTREVDGGLQTIVVKLPALITFDLRLNEPRYASLPNIMKAKKKPLEKKTLTDFGASTAPRLKVRTFGGWRAMPDRSRMSWLPTSLRFGVGAKRLRSR